MKHKKYDVKLQDLTPLVGPFIYQHRRWKEGVQGPYPYDSYLHMTGILLAVDFASLIGLIKGLETLLK